MEKCKLLAFLLCERATREPDGKVTLHGLFDRIIIPRTSAKPKLFFVFYKVVVKEPCIVSLRVIDPLGREIPGNWRDSLTNIGPMQAIWALTSDLFKQPGPHALELRQETDHPEALSLAHMLVVVEQDEE
jgi:hypothetical protein